MMFLPVSLNISEKKILIIGGGNVALHKIGFLTRYAKYEQITVIAPEILDAVKAKGVNFIEKKYEPFDLEGSFLVYAATNNNNLNIKIKNECEKRNILVNVVDTPEECVFVSPAIYKKDNMSVAVSSNGENVHRSIRWRNKIRDLFEGNSNNV